MKTIKSIETEEFLLKLEEKQDQYTITSIQGNFTHKIENINDLGHARWTFDRVYEELNGILH